MINVCVNEPVHYEAVAERYYNYSCLSYISHISEVIIDVYFSVLGYVILFTAFFKCHRLKQMHEQPIILKNKTRCLLTRMFFFFFYDPGSDAKSCHV